MESEPPETATTTRVPDCARACWRIDRRTTSMRCMSCQVREEPWLSGRQGVADSLYRALGATSDLHHGVLARPTAGSDRPTLPPWPIAARCRRPTAIDRRR